LIVKPQEQTTISTTINFSSNGGVHLSGNQDQIEGFPYSTDDMELASATFYQLPGFSFLFNIFRPADDPINKGRVPDSFYHLDFSGFESDVEEDLISSEGLPCKLFNQIKLIVCIGFYYLDVCLLRLSWLCLIGCLTRFVESPIVRDIHRSKCCLCPWTSKTGIFDLWPAWTKFLGGELRLMLLVSYKMSTAGHV